jgi:hypothetical protein
MKNSSLVSIADCLLIRLKKIKNRAGNLSTIEDSKDIPFKVKRVFYIYDIPGGENRGAHAHEKCHQFLIAGSGSFTVELMDGRNKKKVVLNRPYFGLHIPPGIWAAETEFSSGAICLALTSENYDENDYIRDYKDFLNQYG